MTRLWAERRMKSKKSITLSNESTYKLFIPLEVQRQPLLITAKLRRFSTSHIDTIFCLLVTSLTMRRFLTSSNGSVGIQSGLGHQGRKRKNFSMLGRTEAVHFSAARCSSRNYWSCDRGLRFIQIWFAVKNRNDSTFPWNWHHGC